jgi:hypothetical protein
VINGEILPISFLAVFIPFAGKDTFSADAFETSAHAADSCEKIDKSELRAITF